MIQLKKMIFFHVDKYSQKLKADRKFFGWTWSKMGVTSLAIVL